METISAIRELQDPAIAIASASIEKELKWQLTTIVGTTGAFLCFFIMTFLLPSMPQTVVLLPIPLIIYNLVKSGYCTVQVYYLPDKDKTNPLKDLVEAIIMIFFEVTVKISYK